MDSLGSQVFVAAAAAFLGLGFWLIRGIGFREFSILELGLFWARSCGELAGWGACLLLWGPVVGFRLLTAAWY